MSVLASLNILVGMDIKDVQAGTRATRAELKALGGDARKVWDETRTPQERYASRLQSLSGQLRSGAIGQETFARAARKASLEMSQASAPEFKTRDLSAYASKLEELSGLLASGAIGQSQFAAAAGQAAAALESSGGAAAAAGGSHEHANHAAAAYQERVRQLDVSLRHGKITFEQYAEGIDQAKERMEAAERSARRMERALDVAKVAIATVGVTYGLEATAEFLKGSWEAADEAKASLGRLEAIVRATGGAAGFSAREMRELAKGEQEATNYSHLQVEAAEAVLATHRQISGMNFRGAVSASADLSAVLGEDMRSSATMLGRALADPERGLVGLSRAGITFTATEREAISAMVKAGHAAEAQSAILDKLKESMGGAAEGMQTASAHISNAWDDVKESVGGMMQSLGGSDALKEVAHTLGDLAGDFEDISQAASAHDVVEAYGNALMHGSLGLSGLDLDDLGLIRHVEKMPEMERPASASAPAEVQSEEHHKAAVSLGQLVDKMREENSLLGLEGSAREITRLKLQGLTEAEVSEARALAQAQQARQREIDQLREQKNRVDQLAESVKQFRDSLRSQVENFGLSGDEARIKDMERDLADRQDELNARRGGKGMAEADRGAAFGRRSAELDEEADRLADRRAAYEERKTAARGGASGSYNRLDLEALLEERKAIAEEEAALAKKREALADDRSAAQRERLNATFDLEMQQRELDLARERLEESKRKLKERDGLEAQRKQKEESDRFFADFFDEFDKASPVKKRKEEYKATAPMLKGSAAAFSAVVRLLPGGRLTVEKQSIAELREIRRALFDQGKAQRKANAPASIRNI